MHSASPGTLLSFPNNELPHVVKIILQRRRGRVTCWASVRPSVCPSVRSADCCVLSPGRYWAAQIGQVTAVWGGCRFDAAVCTGSCRYAAVDWLCASSGCGQGSRGPHAYMQWVMMMWTIGRSRYNMLIEMRRYGACHPGGHCWDQCPGTLSQVMVFRADSRFARS